MKDLRGVFVHADEDQLNAIWMACAREGFTQDSAGVLALLMLAVNPPEDEEDEALRPDPISAIADHLAANPEAAAALRNAGAKLFGAVMGKFKKPGT